MLDLATPAADRPQDAVADEMIDDTARKEYRARIMELRSELDEAEGWNDAARAQRLHEELDALTAELARGTGLGGRSPALRHECRARPGQRAAADP